MRMHVGRGGRESVGKALAGRAWTSCMAAPCPEQSAEEILERNARIRRIRRVLVDETDNGSEGSAIPHFLACAFAHFHT